MKRFADRIDIDVHGNLSAVLNPEGTPRVMLAGHCDQIGMMVNFIDDNGYMFFRQIGGIDPSVLPGSRVVVHTRHGPVDGLIPWASLTSIPLHTTSISSVSSTRAAQMHLMWT